MPKKELDQGGKERRNDVVHTCALGYRESAQRHRGPIARMLKHTLADLLQADPDLERRLKEAGIWKRVDAGWALGSAATHLGYPKDLWRGEQDAAIAEIRAKVGRVE